MGLDMYCYSFPAEILDGVTSGKEVDFNPTKEQYEKFNEFQYWRKFNALHGWMRDLYYAKGGTSEEFNCDYLLLTSHDLAKLALDVNSLKPTEGFFFGGLRYDEEDKQTVLKFVREALNEIEDGRCIAYTSWW